MPIEQTIWSLDTGVELALDQLKSEKEIEELLAKNIGLLSNEWMVIGRQVHTISGGIVDLLCIDRAGDLIVVELKRNLTPREVTAQALDYAACVAAYVYADAQLIFSKYTAEGLQGLTLSEIFQKRYKETLDEENFNTNPVQIVIVAAQMDDSTERIVTYLKSQYGLPINILFFKVYSFDGKRFISRAWYLEKAAVLKGNADMPTSGWNGEYYVSFGINDDRRSWDDALKYGFISAGGGAWYSQTLSMLSVGDRVWVNIPQTGYVGVGKVIATAAMAKDAIFTVNGEEINFVDLNLKGKYGSRNESEDEAEYIVQVEWIKKLPVNKAVKEPGFFGNQNSVCKPRTAKWQFTVERLKALWVLQ